MHRATLVDGQEVVIKVQHDGIKEIILEVFCFLWLLRLWMHSINWSYFTGNEFVAILQDLKNAKSIVDWIAWAEPQFDFNPMIDEWCKEAPKELDFNIEAGMINTP